MNGFVNVSATVYDANDRELEVLGTVDMWGHVEPWESCCDAAEAGGVRRRHLLGAPGAPLSWRFERQYEDSQCVEAG